MSKNNASLLDLWGLGKKYVTLKFESARLTLAEKATIFFGTVFLGLTALIFVAIIFVLLMVGVCNLLAELLPFYLVCFSAAGILIVVGLVIYLLRYVLIFNPLARFFTQILFDYENDK
ncbi:MAG: hypothetical protein K2O00_04420 [Muribaculaceae bacterium]|nr:hypothetical protein [Muribaculaceae bacterium]